MRDAVIVGAGHNGLVCAFYLARAGLKVTVREARGVVGGAAVTEEFHPGFRNSVAAYTVSLRNPKVIDDMDPGRHGLRIVERAFANFPPLDDRHYLKIGAGQTTVSFKATRAGRHHAGDGGSGAGARRGDPHGLRGGRGHAGQGRRRRRRYLQRRADRRARGRLQPESAPAVHAAGRPGRAAR